MIVIPQHGASVDKIRLKIHQIDVGDHRSEFELTVEYSLHQ